MLTQVLGQSDTGGSASSAEWGSWAAAKLVYLVEFFNRDPMNFVKVGLALLMIVAVITVIRFISIVAFYVVACILVFGLLMGPMRPTVKEYSCKLFGILHIEFIGFYCDREDKPVPAKKDPSPTKTPPTSTVTTSTSIQNTNAIFEDFPSIDTHPDISASVQKWRQAYNEWQDKLNEVEDFYRTIGQQWRQSYNKWLVASREINDLYTATSPEWQQLHNKWLAEGREADDLYLMMSVLRGVSGVSHHVSTLWLWMITHLENVAPRGSA